MGIEAQHNHCNNGRFVDNIFQRDVPDKGQTISHFGVNAHFQNGIAEKMTRDLQDHARKTLIHTKIR